MLKTRVLTALALLLILLLVLFSHSFHVFSVTMALFFGAAAWESLRLFNSKNARAVAVVWTAIFVLLLYERDIAKAQLLFGLCCALWVIRFAPSLIYGLPTTMGFGNRLLSAMYLIALVGCFMAMSALLSHSPLYLLSVLSIVWVADIGAYFSGKAWGKFKLAPSISPGKSWEGVVGGWLAVLLVSAASLFIPALDMTFSPVIQARWGWGGWLLVLTMLVAASIVGDLFESQLKRRADRKDSSNLLPGHGGVLDRIDAVIPVLPFAALLTFWL